ncbi:transcription factor CP2 isoform X2 [Cimex lectularius]|uniref:Grh/CP2 DB domain-containing protein n=1 Tax=Cimex lectularius TaxID=79782 RepID=A0A8I6SRI5_CIMLE|nr:transcription factor CP2 isoform X2 [Cimex lectularius]
MDMYRNCNAGGQVSPWDQVEVLSVDLDGSCSLTGLNVDLTSPNFTNSEALLSLPSLSAFKQELLSPFHGQEGTNGEINVPVNTCNEPIQQCYCEEANDQTVSKDFKLGEQSPNQSDDSSKAVVLSTPATSATTPSAEDCRFQYVLAAASSIATTVSEETLTYLNQRQPYEIKLKKLGDLSEYRGKILKSVLRLCFLERKLQVMEKELMSAWVSTHPGDSILEVDHSLSYGIFGLSSEKFNSVEFLWDPTKEVGVYIKVNCISSEFTQKKHGGEKGVPFRIQVETYHGVGQVRRLHAASCQVKVFKLKGAERKHKQDREKFQKRSLAEQEIYQRSYECTVLTDMVVNNDSYSLPEITSSSSPILSSSDMAGFRQVLTNSPSTSREEAKPQLDLQTPPNSPKQGFEVGNGTSQYDCVNASWGPQQVALWLTLNRYGTHIHQTLSTYSGADLLRLSKEDLIQLCGLSDGIRLHNAIHSKCIIPKLTLYICINQKEQVYQVIYLKSLTKLELLVKICQILKIDQVQVSSAYLQGPNGIRVLMTDQLITHIPDHTLFTIHLSHDGPDRYELLCKESEIKSPV